MDHQPTVQRRPFGSWLLGTVDQRPAALRLRVRILLTLLLWSANLIGAAVVFTLAIFAVPGPPLTSETRTVIFITTPIYVLFAQIAGCFWSLRRASRTIHWLSEDRPATIAEQRATLRLPLTLSLIEAFFWLLGAALFTGLAAVLQPDQVDKVAMTTILGGIVTQPTPTC